MYKEKIVSDLFRHNFPVTILIKLIHKKFQMPGEKQKIKANKKYSGRNASRNNVAIHYIVNIKKIILKLNKTELWLAKYISYCYCHCAKKLENHSNR